MAKRAFGAQWSVARCAKFSKTQYGEFDNETAKRDKTQWHSNKIQHNEFTKASTANGAHSTTNSTKYGEFGNANSARRYFVSEKMHDTTSTANSVWQAFADKTTHDKFGLASVAKWAVLAGETGKAKMGWCLGGTSLSRCLQFLAH